MRRRKPSGGADITLAIALQREVDPAEVLPRKFGITDADRSKVPQVTALGDEDIDNDLRFDS